MPTRVPDHDDGAAPAVSLVAWLVPLHASGARDADPAIGDDT
jgi:hypothetical protein